MAETKERNLYELLLMRGNLSIAALRKIRDMADELLRAFDAVDAEWRVPVGADDTNRALVEAMRKAYPHLADATDAEIIATLNQINR